MSKFMKISALSLALIASLLLLSNTASATQNTGNLSLRINAGTNGCGYGTSLDLGSIAISTAATALTGTFTTPATFYCSDNGATAINSRSMTLQASTNLTGTYGQTIPNSNVYLKTSSTSMTGSCTAGAGTTSFTAINTAQSIVAKTAATGQVCTLSVNNVQLAVQIPANQSVGAYTGTLTLDRPF